VQSEIWKTKVSDSTIIFESELPCHSEPTIDSLSLLDLEDAYGGEDLFNPTTNRPQDDLFEFIFGIDE
jgi:hypothetical protein